MSNIPHFDRQNERFIWVLSWFSPVSCYTTARTSRYWINFKFLVAFAVYFSFSTNERVKITSKKKNRKIKLHELRKPHGDYWTLDFKQLQV